MSIIRSPRTHSYTILDNTGPNDPRLSWGGVGLLTYLLTKPDNWQVSVAHLTKFRALGRDGVYKLLAELEECGYLKKSRAKADQGRFSKFEYVVYDRPQGDTKPPLTDIPEMDSPLPALPDTVKPTLVNTDKEVITEKVNNSNARAREEVSAKPAQEESPKPATPKPQPAKQQLPAPPAWLSDDAWQAFLDMRKSIKAPITPRAAQTAINKLTEFHHDGYDANEVLDEIVLRCWRGIYLPDNLKKRNAQNFEGRGRHEDNRRNHKLSAAERAIEDEREFERRSQAEYCRVYDIAGQRIK